MTTETQSDPTYQQLELRHLELEERHLAYKERCLEMEIISREDYRGEARRLAQANNALLASMLDELKKLNAPKP